MLICMRACESCDRWHHLSSYHCVKAKSKESVREIKKTISFELLRFQWTKENTTPSVLRCCIKIKDVTRKIDDYAFKKQNDNHDDEKLKRTYTDRSIVM